MSVEYVMILRSLMTSILATFEVTPLRLAVILVNPMLTPVTRPLELTDATPGASLVQVTSDATSRVEPSL